METFLEGGCTKIDEKTNMQVHQTHIGQKLLAMNRYQLFYRFEFHDNPAFNQQVGPESLLKHNTVVFKPDCFLTLDLKTAFLQSLGQYHLVN